MEGLGGRLVHPSILKRFYHLLPNLNKLQPHANDSAFTSVTGQKRGIVSLPFSIIPYSTTSLGDDQQLLVLCS